MRMMMVMTMRMMMVVMRGRRLFGHVSFKSFPGLEVNEGVSD